MYDMPQTFRRQPGVYEAVERWRPTLTVILAISTVVLGTTTLALHGQLRTIEPEGDDAAYHSVMREYEAVRDDPHLRRYLIAKIKSLAAERQVDPDLLFSVIAVESSFRVVAKSEKNARGLGQLMFGTAKALNPAAISHPDDLYDVHLNLDTALKYLKANLVRNRDDIRMSLLVYYYGDAARRPGFQDTDQYVQKVMDCYNRLQQRRKALEWTGPILTAVHQLSG